MRPLGLVYEAYVAMSHVAAVRDAVREWARVVQQLSHGAPGRPLAESDAERAVAKGAYDAAIEASGDERVIAAKRPYDDAVARETEQFVRKLR